MVTMLRRTTLILLLFTGVSFAESREADWWRRQLRELFPPAEIGIRYKAIITNADDQSIVIDSPSVTLRDPSTGELALLTSDRITLWPDGPLNPAKPLAMKAIRFDKPVLNLALAPPPGTRPVTRPTTLPTTQPDFQGINELLKTLRKIEVEQGQIIFKLPDGGSGEVKSLTISVMQNEKGEWTGTTTTDLIPSLGAISGTITVKLDGDKPSINIDGKFVPTTQPVYGAP